MKAKSLKLVVGLIFAAVAMLSPATAIGQEEDLGPAWVSLPAIEPVGTDESIGGLIQQGEDLIEARGLTINEKYWHYEVLKLKMLRYLVYAVAGECPAQVVPAPE